MQYWIIPVDGPRLTDRHDLLGPYNTTDLAEHICDQYRAAGYACDVIQSATRPLHRPAEITPRPAGSGREEEDTS